MISLAGSHSVRSVRIRILIAIFWLSSKRELFPKPCPDNRSYFWRFRFEPFDVFVPFPIAYLAYRIFAASAFEFFNHLCAGDCTLEKASERAVFKPQFLHTLVRKPARMQPLRLRYHPPSNSRE